MFKLIKVCFAIAVVMFIIPEDKNSKNLTSDDRSIKEIAVHELNQKVEQVSQFCKSNPSACLEGLSEANDFKQKTLDTARSVYDYLAEDNQNDQSKLEKIILDSPKMTQEVARTASNENAKTHSLSISDLNIDLSAAELQ